MALIESISDRKGVDRRRSRGQLLGVKDSNVLRHPLWQFDLDLGETVPGLPQLLAALTEATPNAAAADALMTTERADLDGRTLAELFREGRVDLVVQLVAMAGDQS